MADYRALVLDRGTGGIRELNNNDRLIGYEKALPAPSDVYDDHPVFFYFGFADFEGGWLIQRQGRATSITMQASGAADYAGAWAARESLEYA